MNVYAQCSQSACCILICSSYSGGKRLIDHSLRFESHPFGVIAAGSTLGGIVVLPFFVGQFET